MAKVKHLTQKETDALLAYFGQIRDEMRMSQWDLIIMDEEPEEDNTIIEVTPCDNHYAGQLRIGKGWSRQPDQVKTDTVVHELLHLCHRELTDLWRQVTEDNKGMSVSDAGLLYNFWFTSVERMVSHLSHLLGDHVTPWPGDGIKRVGVYIEGEHR